MRTDPPPRLHLLSEPEQDEADPRRAGAAAAAEEEADPFAGSSPAICALARAATRLAASDSPILILGETGSGKGVLARWLHRRSRRGSGPFMDLNCAGFSRELLDAELCGHARGAFTGAVAAKPGLFEAAHGGSVFLDELGDMDERIQPKLLKLLEERRVRRLGEVRDRPIDVRLIAATHRDLAQLSTEGGFRSDLYFRLSTLPIHVPPLRERVEDIPQLARTLLARVARGIGRGPIALADDALESLRRHAWPGNIRELRNVLERAAWLNDTTLLRARDLAYDRVRPAPAADHAHLTLEAMERLHLQRVLDAVGGQVQTAAQRLGIPRSSLYQKLKRFGITTRRG